MFQSPALLVCAAGFLLLSTGCGETDSDGSSSDDTLAVDGQVSPFTDTDEEAADEDTSLDTVTPDAIAPSDTPGVDAATVDGTSTGDAGPLWDADPAGDADPGGDVDPGGDAGLIGDVDPAGDAGSAGDAEVSAEDVIGDAADGVDEDVIEDVVDAEEVIDPPPECVVDSDCESTTWCQTWACDHSTGTCQVTTDADGTPCEDGTACSEADTCQGGVCLGGIALVCDDGNLCTDDICAPATGCVYAFNLGGCDDDNPCTANDLCLGGVCSGKTSACDDGNPCTLDHCLPGSGECIYTDDDTLPCADNSQCTGGDHCSNGACLAGEIDACDDGNDCTTDSCDEGLCKNFPLEDEPCDDGEVCTANDLCLLAVCVPGQPDDCDDNNACTTDSCIFGAGCVHEVTVDVACDDGDVCTDGGVCDDEGACVPATTQDCDDANPCTVDNCHPQNGCVYALKAGGCDDGNLCTAGDFCVGGQCKGQPATCNDADACTHDSCDDVLGCEFVSIAATCTDDDLCTDDLCDSASGCIFTPNTEPCDDGLLCTEQDACSDGACTGQAVVCADDDPCTGGTCDAEIGCVIVITPGVECDDQDVCTAATTCAVDGSCAGGEPTDVDDGVACTLDACTEGEGVVHLADDSACLAGRRCDVSVGCVLDDPALLIAKFAWTEDDGLTWIAVINRGDVAVDLLGLSVSDGDGGTAPLVASSGDVSASILIAPGATVAATRSPLTLPDTSTDGFSALLGTPESPPTPLLVPGGILSLLDEHGEVVDTLNVSSIVGSGDVGPTDFPMHPGAACELGATAAMVADASQDNDSAGLWCSWPSGAAGPEGAQLPCTRARLNEIALAGVDGARWIELHMPAGGALDGLALRIVGADGEVLAQVEPLAGRTPMSTLVLLTDGLDDVVLPQVTEGAVQLIREGSLVDVCGFGALSTHHDQTFNVPMLEGDAAGALVDTHALARVPDGADTDDNAADWLLIEGGSPGETNGALP